MKGIDVEAFARPSDLAETDVTEQPLRAPGRPRKPPRYVEQPDGRDHLAALPAHLRKPLKPPGR